MVVMYSQYNYYQSNSNSSNQQPQQQQQTTSTANQVWNGQQWVSTNNATNQQQSYAQAASAGTTQQGANGQGIVGGGSGQSMIIKHGKTHAELVQHYTSCKFYVCGCLDVYLRVCAGLCISCVHFFWELISLLTYTTSTLTTYNSHLHTTLIQ